MAEGLYTIDDAAWPVVVITYQGLVSDDAFAIYIDKLNKNLLRHERYWAILDARAALVPPLPQRQRKLAWLKSHSQELQTFCDGSAFIINSAVLRGALGALMWMAKPSFRYSIVEDMDKAWRWVDRLRALSMPGGG